MDKELELINQLATQFGIIQTLLLLMGFIGFFYILYNVRSTHTLARGQSANMINVSALAQTQETNSATSEKRWHERISHYETERAENGKRISQLQDRLTEVTNNNSYGHGAIDTLKALYEKDKKDLLEKIEALARDVDALKKQRQHQDTLIAEQIETITSHETEIRRLGGLLKATQDKLDERDRQLKTKIIELKVAEKKRKECEEKQAEENAPEDDKTIQFNDPKQDEKASA